MHVPPPSRLGGISILSRVQATKVKVKNALTWIWFTRRRAGHR
jgi:hypothetical protein